MTGCLVLLCNFHREQAWERWVKKADNGVGEKERSNTLLLMRAVAKAENENAYQMALKNLTNSEV